MATEGERASRQWAREAGVVVLCLQMCDKLKPEFVNHVQALGQIAPADFWEHGVFSILKDMHDKDPDDDEDWSDLCDTFELAKETLRQSPNYDRVATVARRYESADLDTLVDRLSRVRPPQFEFLLSKNRAP